MSFCTITDVHLIFQVWQTQDGSNFVRIMHEGTPVETLDWIPLDDFIGLLEENVPPNLFEACTVVTDD